MLRFPLLPALAFLAAASVSCTTVDTSEGGLSLRARGQTEYLAGITVPSNAGAPRPGPRPAEDNFSFWEDDGVGGPPRVKLDLGEQAAFFYRGDHLVGRSPISAGTPDHPTPTGNFKVINKDPDHKSSVYGWIVDGEGNVLNDNADIRVDRIPKGCKFDHSKMTWFMQFYPAIGMHAGHLPGYPASHGCVRMPEHMAKTFYDHVPIGTPVTVVR